MVGHENRDPSNRESTNRESTNHESAHGEKMNPEMNQENIGCEKIWHEISNFLDGDVDAALRSAMDQHFRTCPRCASVLAGTKNVVRLYGDERMMEAPAGFSKRLEKRLARNARPARSRWLSMEAWLIPVAALALVVGGLHFANSWATQRARRDLMAQAAKNIPPDMVVLVAADSKIFHVAGCSFIHGKQVRSLTAKEALKEGYAPCTRCLRKYLQTAKAGPAGSIVQDDDAHADLEEENNPPGQAANLAAK